MNKEQKIVIIDYQVGNLSSIANMLKKVGQKSIISGDINEIKSADKLILPGVGSFDYGMNKLNESGITEVLNEKAFVFFFAFLLVCDLIAKRQSLAWVLLSQFTKSFEVCC